MALRNIKGIASETKDLILFFKRTNKLYLIPFVLLLIIIVLLIISASTSPAAVFIYPLI